MSDKWDTWPQVTTENRPWTRWWWPGAAVDKENIARLMETYHEAGLGGVEITSIYGVKGQEKRNIEYLSEQWAGMVKYAIKEAERLGMQVDIPNTSGWRTGGAYITDRVAAANLKIEKNDVESGYTARIVPSGELVKRAGPGGRGKTFNPFSSSSLQVVMDHLSPVFKELGMRAQFHDSWEYDSDVCAELFDFFKEKRKYDLNEHLADLVENTENHARVKYDLQLTLAEMIVDCFIVPWTKWCNEMGQLSRNQAHGSPGNWLDIYAASDIPETEVYRDNTPDTPLISKFASSAAHVSGKNLASSETGTWLKEHFQTSLGDLKKLLDNLFTAGINHNIYHGTAYSPDDAGWPGWLFYASSQLNPQNSIWRDFGKLNEYVTRCQSILQNGKPDNELLVYFPLHDLLHDPTRELAEKITIKGDWINELAAVDTFRLLWRRGYSFDYVSDRQLKEIKYKDNMLMTPGGTYRAIVVPPCQFIPVDTLEKLIRLSAEGGNIVFMSPGPSDVPGLTELESRRGSFRSLLKQIKPVNDIELALSKLNIERESLKDHPDLFFIRRKNGSTHDYFVVNQGSKALDEWISPAVTCNSALIMDPMSGRTGIAQMRNRKIRVQLEPGASLIVRTLDKVLNVKEKWTYTECGKSYSLEGTWKVKFIEGGPSIPPLCETTILSSWTDYDGDARRFAGTAVYSIEFDMPSDETRCLLDLGEVHSSARVRLNGKYIDTLIGPTFKIMLEGLKLSGNVLDIEVTNLAANRIRDLDKRGVKWKIFEDINFIDRNGKDFDAAEWPLTVSGLLGPVQLISQK